MSKEYVFWFEMIRRSGFYSLSVLRSIPKRLTKVVVTERQIMSDGPIDINGQDILAINLLDITRITWSVSFPGSVGSIEIITQESGQYHLMPTNPLEPTLILISDNMDEVIAFCDIVNALKTNHLPDIDENPYIRQFQKDTKPTYLTKKDVALWDKNVSPLEYFYEFVPESEIKKLHLRIKVYKVVEFGGIIILILGLLYVLVELIE